MRYGLSYMEQSGCGIIAAYNALILLDNPRSLQSLILWGDLNASIVFAQFGSNPWAIGSLFEGLGYYVYHVYNQAQYDAEIKNANLAIFTYWNNKGHVFDGAHTVCVQYASGVINVYNEYNNVTTASKKNSIRKWISDNNLDPIDFCCIRK